MTKPKPRRIIIRLSRRETPARRHQQKTSSPRDGESSPWVVRALFCVYILAIIWTSLAYASESSASGTSTVPAAYVPGGNFLAVTPSEVPDYVQRSAKAAGVSPRVAEWIVSHESQHHPGATGDGGESRGIWQINRVYHPEVSDKCAYDVRCSTDWSLRRIHDGYVSEWSTWKYCHAWFDDCPF